MKTIEGTKSEGGKERGRGRRREMELAVANRNSRVASLRCSGDLGNELAAADTLI